MADLVEFHYDPSEDPFAGMPKPGDVLYAYDPAGNVIGKGIVEEYNEGDRWLKFVPCWPEDNE